MNDIHFLTVQEVIHIHFNFIEMFGGIHGIRDINLLDSAIKSPQAGVGNTYLHKDIFHMAATYACGLIKNHPFLDGNKRTGIFSSFLFLERNGHKITLTSENMYDLGMGIAKSEITQEYLANTFEKYSRR